MQNSHFYDFLVFKEALRSLAKRICSRSKCRSQICRITFSLKDKTIGAIVILFLIHSSIAAK